VDATVAGRRGRGVRKKLVGRHEVEWAAHVAAAGLDAHEYLRADRTGRLVIEAVADRAREMRREDLAMVLEGLFGG
jgi:hypothetical protein